MQRELEENLLQAWIDMSVCIRGNRMLSQISFNEIVICGILYRNTLQGEDMLTATDLCKKTRLLKSQINRLLTSMEENGLICRERSTGDRRKFHIALLEKGKALYEEEHEHIMQMMIAVTGALGESRTIQLTELVNETIGIVNQL